MRLIRTVLLSAAITLTSNAIASSATDPASDFESRGFQVTYLTADGKEISRDEFRKRGEGQEVSMRVDGDNKTVVITIGGAIPEELRQPLQISVGASLPRVLPADLDGAPHRWPRADRKFTVLSFYFSGCGPCIEEIPELNEFAARRTDVSLLAVTFDSKEETRQFIEQRKFAVDVVPEAREFIDALGVSAYPMFVLVDPEGRLASVREIIPQDKDESLDSWVDRTMAQLR